MYICMYVYIYIRIFREKSYANRYESLICILRFQNFHISFFEMNILLIAFINRISRVSPCTLHTNHYCGAIRHSGLINVSNSTMAWPIYYR